MVGSLSKDTLNAAPCSLGKHLCLTDCEVWQTHQELGFKLCFTKHSSGEARSNNQSN